MASLKTQSKYEILTDSGWSDFVGIRKKPTKGIVTIVLDDGNSLECSLNHKVECQWGFSESKDLIVGEKIKTISGYSTVIALYIDKHIECDVFDALEVKNQHKYITNNIVSHNCEFMGSSGTLISGTKLKQLVFQDPIHEKDGLTMYQHPVPNQQYACIIDVSRGKGLDYSAFHIINVTQMPYHQVCTYRDNMTTPIEYTKIIYEMCKHYNEAYVLVEINDIGDQVASSLYEDYEYENMLFTENNGRSGKRLVAGFSTKNCDKGIRTTKSVKSVGCSMLKLLIEQNQLIINDFQTIKELSTFSKKGSSWEAEVNCHDDLVMGLVLFAWLTNQKFFKEFTDINTVNQLRDLNDEQLMNNLVPFGIIDDGRDDYQDEIVTAGRDDRWLLQDEIMWN